MIDDARGIEAAFSSHSMTQIIGREQEAAAQDIGDAMRHAFVDGMREFVENMACEPAHHTQQKHSIIMIMIVFMMIMIMMMIVMIMLLVYPLTPRIRYKNGNKSKVSQCHNASLLMLEDVIQGRGHKSHGHDTIEGQEVSPFVEHVQVRGRCQKISPQGKEDGQKGENGAIEDAEEGGIIGSLE